MKEGEWKKYLVNATDENMQETLDKLEFIYDKAFAAMNDWGDIYGYMEDSEYQIAKVSSIDIPETLDMVYATLSSFFLKGYISFRLAQPTMTDFEMSKALLREHIREKMKEGYARYQHYKHAIN